MPEQFEHHNPEHAELLRREKTLKLLLDGFKKLIPEQQERMRAAYPEIYNSLEKDLEDVQRKLKEMQ